MSSPDSALEGDAPTPTASRFFDLDLFSNPIVKPGFSFPHVRSSVAPSDARAASAALARQDRLQVLSISSLISPPTSPTAPSPLGEFAPAVWDMYRFRGPPREVVVEDLDEGKSDGEPAVKRQKLDPFQPPVSALRRYSARAQSRRTAKTAERVWNFLPKEIQLNIWGLAIKDELVGRVVVVQNRNSPYFNDYVIGSVNLLPDISRVSQQARSEFQRHYRKMFARIPLKSPQTDYFRAQLSKLRPSIEAALQPIKALSVADEFWHNRYNVPELKEPLQPKQTFETMLELGRKQVENWLDKGEEQWVNVDKDIIQIEPCCDGCRACHCVKRQFTDPDREAVRFLCVKGEPWWAVSAHVRPCWISLCDVFPNAETLYLDIEKTGPTALIRAKRVMVRVRPEGVMAHHIACLAAFELWKRADGKGKKLSRIELVSVYEERPRPRGKPDGMQYPRAKRDSDNIFIIR